MAALELVAGVAAVTGPGVAVTLTDARPGAGTGAVAPGAPVPAAGRINDQDLQGVVNAL